MLGAKPFLFSKTMEPDLHSKPKQTASEFWKSYFSKFRRQVQDHEESETGPAPLSAASGPALHFPERRRLGLWRSRADLGSR